VLISPYKEVIHMEGNLRRHPGLERARPLLAFELVLEGLIHR
jgi:hypothetical protein